jgi:hypothetical protein
MVVVLLSELVVLFFRALRLNCIPSFPVPAVTANARSGAGGVRLGGSTPGRSLVG